MLIDYKFWYIKRDDNGFITETTVRFYEGIIINNGGINRYTRTKRLTKLEMPYITQNIAKELNGTDAVLYTNSDFGSIKTEYELRIFLNAQLVKDVTRTAIKEQTIAIV